MVPNLSVGELNLWSSQNGAAWRSGPFLIGKGVWCGSLLQARLALDWLPIIVKRRLVEAVKRINGKGVEI